MTNRGVVNEVALGFMEDSKNQLIMTPEFTPSKVGGRPAWVAPKGTPSLWCEKCGYKMSLLLQLYANIDEESMDDFHRMLYVFVCISEKCVGT